MWRACVVVSGSVLAMVACGGNHGDPPCAVPCGSGEHCTSDGRCVGGPDGCTGLRCQVTDCQRQGLPATTITGTVFAPNGTLPLFGVNVYVPGADPGALSPGVQCGSCSDALPGDPIVRTVTDEAGRFELPFAPDGSDIPLVIATGKWRRQIRLASVAPCTTAAVAAGDTTLPRSRDDRTPITTSVDLPQIAISTGSADSLECLVRRLGIADREITTDQQGGRIHLFADTGATVEGAGVGVSRFDPDFGLGFGGGTGAFSDARTLWGTDSDPGKLDDYDIVILSCEGAQHVETKPQQAMDHLKAYADRGGRVFLSHWHNVWIEGSTTGKNANATQPAVWPSLAQWSNALTPGPTDDRIDEVGNPKGAAFATWMLNVGGSPPGMRGAVAIQDGTGKDTCVAVDASRAEQWVYWQKDDRTRLAQNFQFSTPSEQPPGARCGKVVFSDMHVSGGPIRDSGAIPPYPTSCGVDTELSPQEKALAFMFFDISSCVGVLF